MSSPQAVNLGGVATGARLIVTTDQTIKVAINGTTALWPVSKAVLLEGTFTSLYLKNENTSREATVRVLVTD